MKFSLDGPESEDGCPLIHKKIKKKLNTNKNATMIRTTRIFFASVTNLQRIVGYIRKGEDWNTGIQQKKGGICIVLI